MRIVRILDAAGEPQPGVVQGSKVSLFAGSAWGDRRPTGQTVPFDPARLVAPLIPTNILCIGRNYREHAAEGNAEVPKAPLLFIKATSALNHPGAAIRLPRVAPTNVDFEAELAVVIGRAATAVAESNALSYVLGYTCANDVSARDCQRGDGQWARAKSFDTFCPLGPWIETDLDLRSVDVRGRLNGKVMQRGNTSELVFSIPYLIHYLSQGLTLLPGTVILTGTPAGCGFARTPPVWLKPGDVYEVEIDGIGTLVNPVAE